MCALNSHEHMSGMMETCIDMERYFECDKAYYDKNIYVFIFMLLYAFRSLYPKCYQSLPLTSGPPGDFCFYLWVLEDRQRAYTMLIIKMVSKSRDGRKAF